MPTASLLRYLPVVLATLVAIALPAAVDAQSKPQWQRELEAATALTNACVALDRIDACVQRTGHLRQAMEAPDADEKIRHDLFATWMTAEREHGETLLLAGQTEQAAAVLVDAYSRVVRHVDGGRHAHALIDNARLMASLAEALLLLGNVESATNVVLNVRGVADHYHQMHEGMGGDTQPAQITYATTTGSAELEQRYATALAKHAGQQQGAARQAAFAAAFEAYDQAIRWSERSIAIDAQIFGSSPHLRKIEYMNLKARAIQEAGDPVRAREAYRAAHDAGGCTTEYERISTSACLASQRGYVRAGGREEELGASVAR